MEEASVETDKSWLWLFSKVKYCRIICITLIATAVAYTHSVYVAGLFENSLNFSHLSRLEREMALRTEMGFYYSYYKTVVEERPFLAAITKLMYDRTVEYPKEVNAFNRFNIHPEVILGSLYRYLEPWLNGSRTCHLVARGPGLAPVESCVGLGEPVMFYLQAVWALAGLTAAAVFVYGTVLSNTVLGGLLSLAWYARHHPDCTRVMWAPNERETFAQPLLLAQACLLTAQLRGRRGGGATLRLQVAIFLLNSFCLLFWQFSQFIFLTQTAIFFVMEQLRVIDLKTLWLFLHANFCGLHMAVLLLQGNDMLKSSLYASFFVVVSAYCLFFSAFRIKVQTRLDLFVESWLVLLRIAIVVCASFWLKGVIGEFLNVEEDTHIWDLLYSKFNSDYKTFHTMIYTCSAVFDFLPFATWKELFVSGLIPVTLVATFNAVFFWYRNAKETLSRPPDERKEGINKAKTSQESNTESDEDSGIENVSESKMADENKMAAGNLNNEEKLVNRADKPVKREKDYLIKFLRNLEIDPGVFYNVSQMVVFGAMAALVMRLKLLFVPHMCLVSSLVMDIKQFPTSSKLRQWTRQMALPALLLYVAAGILRTVREETSHIGEFSDLPQEELLSWIVSRGGGGGRAVFAAPLPLAATVLLATRRAIVCHPHYEHRDARERAYAVYQTYSRCSHTELYRALNKLRVTHLVLDKTYCHGQSSRGCSWEQIWDVVQPALVARPRLCVSLQRAPLDHFYAVFDNSRYTVYKLHDYSVRYMPRLLDT